MTAAMAQAMNGESWQTSRHESKANCTPASECSREVKYKLIKEDRYEKLPKLSSSLPIKDTPKMSLLDLLTLAIDSISGEYRHHYVDEVQYSYTEELYDVVEYQTSSKGVVVGPYKSQTWVPAGGPLLNKEVIGTVNKGATHVSNVPFGKR